VAQGKQGKLQSSYDSIMGKGRQISSAVEDIEYKHPLTGDPHGSQTPQKS